MNFLVRLKTSNAKLRYTIHQALALYLTQRQEPVDTANWLLGMNRHHVHSERIDQHVLLLGGNDAFQPLKLLHRQEQALMNARSVTTRLFTKEEHADQHRQMGNLRLVTSQRLRGDPAGEVISICVPDFPDVYGTGCPSSGLPCCLFLIPFGEWLPPMRAIQHALEAHPAARQGLLVAAGAMTIAGTCYWRSRSSWCTCRTSAGRC